MPPVLDDGVDVAVADHRLAPIPTFDDDDRHAVVGTINSTGSPGEFVHDDAPPVLDDGVDAAVADHHLAPISTINDDDRHAVVDTINSTNPTAQDDDVTVSSAKEGAAGSLPDTIGSRNEFLSKIKFENDLISPTFEKKALIVVVHGADDDGAPDLIKEEEEVGQEPIEHDTGDDCRCLWLCPEPLLKMLRGHNAQNSAVGTPLPKLT